MELRLHLGLQRTLTHTLQTTNDPVFPLWLLPKSAHPVNTHSPQHGVSHSGRSRGLSCLLIISTITPLHFQAGQRSVCDQDVDHSVPTSSPSSYAQGARRCSNTMSRCWRWSHCWRQHHGRRHLLQLQTQPQKQNLLVLVQRKEGGKVGGKNRYPGGEDVLKAAAGLTALHLHWCQSPLGTPELPGGACQHL